jgi:hypothetical protein
MRNGGAEFLHTDRRSFIAVPFLLAFFALSSCVFGQISLVSGNGPSYPKKADSVVFVLAADPPRRAHDSIISALPPQFLDECISGIDSVFNYVEAVRLKRREITGCGRGQKFGRHLVFYNVHKPVMKLLFSCNRLEGGMLDITAEKYPFAIVFKPDFVKKLKRIAAGAKKK